jgi:hypothetical protein
LRSPVHTPSRSPSPRLSANQPSTAAFRLIGPNLEFFARNHKLAGVALTMVDESQTPRYGAYAQYNRQNYKKYYHN